MRVPTKGPGSQDGLLLWVGQISSSPILTVYPQENACLVYTTVSLEFNLVLLFFFVNFVFLISTKNEMPCLDWL